MEIFRPEDWSGLLFPTPGDLPDPRIESASLASPALAGRFFTVVPCGKPPEYTDPSQNAEKQWAAQSFVNKCSPNFHGLFLLEVKVHANLQNSDFLPLHQALLRLPTPRMLLLLESQTYLSSSEPNISLFYSLSTVVSLQTSFPIIHILQSLNLPFLSFFSYILILLFSFAFPYSLREDPSFPITAFHSILSLNKLKDLYFSSYS